MAIPKQVEEAAALAEELFESLNPTDLTVTPPVAPVTPPADEILTQDTPVVPEEDIDELRKYKARYLSLQGKYDAEVPTLHNELKSLKKTVFDRLEQVAPKVAPVVPPEDTRLAKFKEEYGNEYVENIKLLLQQEMVPRMAPVEQKVASMEELQVTTEQEKFSAYLTQTVKGDWQKAWNGQDPKFQEFLSTPDPSGLYTYGELANACVDKWDADRLTKIFNIYFGQNVPALVPPVVPPLPQVTPKAPHPAQEALIAPSRTAAHTTPQNSEKQIWTGEMIKEFQRLDRKPGHYDPETSKALWDDLLAAPGEGRVR